MWFPVMNTSVPCVADKVKFRTSKRIINIMREKRACSLCGLSSILHCPEEVHWSLSSERLSPSILPHRDLLDKCSCADPKLGHMAHKNRVMNFPLVYSNDQGALITTDDHLMMNLKRTWKSKGFFSVFQLPCGTKQGLEINIISFVFCQYNF